MARRPTRKRSRARSTSSRRINGHSTRTNGHSKRANGHSKRTTRHGSRLSPGTINIPRIATSLSGAVRAELVRMGEQDGIDEDFIEDLEDVISDLAEDSPQLFTGLRNAKSRAAIVHEVADELS